MASTAELTITIQGRDQASRIIRDVQNSATGLGRTFGDVGKIAGGVFGGNLLMAGARQATQAIKGVISAGIDFESAFAGVRKTVDATEEEFAVLSRGIRDMSKEIPAAAVEIAGVAEAAGQLGVAQEDILSFTRVMVDLGETTNLTAEEAAVSLARLANIMGTSSSDFDRLGAAIVDLGNNSATTEAEIVEFATRIAGAGEIAGLTEANVLAIGAAFSSAGVQAEAGGTAVQKVLLSMVQAVADGGEELDVFAQAAGVTAEQFRQSFEGDAAGAFTAFVEGLQATGDDAFKVLEALGLQDQRLIRSFLSVANAGDLLRDSIALGSQAWQENTALTTEAAQRYETTAAQLQILKNNITDAAIALSTEVLPAIVAVSQAVVENLPKAIAMIEELYKQHLPALQKTADDIKAVFETVWPVLQPIFERIGEFIGEHILTRIAGVIGAIQSFWEGVRAIIDGIAAAIEGDWDLVWENIKIAAKSGAELAVNAALASFGLLPNLMIGIMEEVLNIVIDGWNRVAEVVSGRVEVFGRNINPAAGQDLTLEQATLPRLPTPGLPFGGGSTEFFDFNAIAAAFQKPVEAAGEAANELTREFEGVGEATKSLSDTLRDAQSVLFGAATREEAELQLRIAKLDASIAKGGNTSGIPTPVIPTPNYAPPDLEAERAALQKRLEIMEADNKVQLLRIELANQTLLTEEEQNRLTEILIVQTETLTGKFGDMEKAVDRFYAALERERKKSDDSGSAPGNAIGTPFVSEDGLHYLHRGEAVLTAADNRNMSRKSVRINTVNIYQGTQRGRDLANDLSLARIAG